MKTYLGDGVYAEIIYGQLVLTTEDGVSTTNTIVFEPEVLANFLAYCNRNLKEAAR
jgi:hypothetical protein